jgi:hypothetical protein
MPVKGSCLCGAVAYEVSGDLEFVGHCHCSMCRKAHGAAFATWGMVPPGRFRWVAGESLVQHYPSSPGRTRCFCRVCGSPLASAHGETVGEVVVGSIDGDPGARPREHIFVGSRAPWHDIADSLPQHEAWPPGLAP